MNYFFLKYYIITKIKLYKLQIRIKLYELFFLKYYIITKIKLYKLQIRIKLYELFENK